MGIYLSIQTQLFSSEHPLGKHRAWKKFRTESAHGAHGFPMMCVCVVAASVLSHCYTQNANAGHGRNSAHRARQGHGRAGLTDNIAPQKFCGVKSILLPTPRAPHFNVV